MKYDNYWFYIQDLKSTQELLKKNELLEQENKKLFETAVTMETFLKSVMESSSKIDKKCNSVNKKLFSSQKLVTALSKKVDELTEIKNSWVNEAMKRSLNKYVSNAKFKLFVCFIYLPCDKIIIVTVNVLHKSYVL